MLQIRLCNESVMSPWARLVFIHLQVEDNQGLLLESEKEESLCPPFKSLLKRQTAAAHLTSTNQASSKQKKVHQAKHNVAEQVEEAKDATLSSQTSFQTNGLNLQTHHNKGQPVHSNPITDQPKVRCGIFQHPAFILCEYVGALLKCKHVGLIV